MRSSAQLLVEKGFDPESIAAQLPGASFQTPIYVTPAWMDRIWRGRALAMTLPWGIYMPADSLAAPAALIVHELAHVQQWRQLGIWRFSRSYLSDYLRGRLRGMSHTSAYATISLEREAVQKARRAVFYNA